MSVRAASAVTVCLFWAACLVPASAFATAYGLADSQNVQQAYMNESAASCGGVDLASRFMELTPKCISGANGQPGPITNIRIFVPWNALNTWSTATNACTQSYDSTHGGAAYNLFVSELTYAQQDGLTPLASITEGTVDGQELGNEPLYPTSQDYICGLSSLMSFSTNFEHLHVPSWEVWNEPDSGANTSNLGDTNSGTFTITNVRGSQACVANGQTISVDNTGPPEWTATLTAGAGTSTWTLSAKPPITASGVRVRAKIGLCHDGLTGASGAANYYADAVFARAGAGTADASDDLPAGAFNNGSVNGNCCSYINGYLNYLAANSIWPSLFSWHPYADVSMAQPLNTLNVANTIGNFYQAHSQPVPHAWLTEASGNLRANDATYAGTAITCTHESDDFHQIGACIDGNPTAQAGAAQEFLSLPTGGFKTPVTRIYWYELQQGVGFDSGLVSNTDPTHTTINVRPSWCVLYGFSTSFASSSSLCQDNHSGLIDEDWLDTGGL